MTSRPLRVEWTHKNFRNRQTRENFSPHCCLLKSENYSGFGLRSCLPCQSQPDRRFRSLSRNRCYSGCWEADALDMLCTSPCLARCFHTSALWHCSLSRSCPRRRKRPEESGRRWERSEVRKRLRCDATRRLHCLSPMSCNVFEQCIRGRPLSSDWKAGAQCLGRPVESMSETIFFYS